jgi:hypothetical protein
MIRLKRYAARTRLSRTNQKETLCPNPKLKFGSPLRPDEPVSGDVFTLITAYQKGIRASAVGNRASAVSRFSGIGTVKTEVKVIQIRPPWNDFFAPDLVTGHVVGLWISGKPHNTDEVLLREVAWAGTNFLQPAHTVYSAERATTCAILRGERRVDYRRHRGNLQLGQTRNPVRQSMPPRGDHCKGASE